MKAMSITITVITTCFALPLSAQVRAPAGQEEPRSAAPAAGQQAGSGSLKDAIELCERLAGTEREICLKQARENRERAEMSATPDRAKPPSGAPGSDPGRGSGAGGGR